MEWKNRLLDSDDSDPENDGPVKNPLTVLVEGEIPKSRTTKNLEKRAVQHQEKVDHIEYKQKFMPYSATKKTILDDELKSQLGDGGTCLLSSRNKPQVEHRTPSIPLPPSYSCQTRQISLGDSLILQQEIERKLKDLQQKQAVERLNATRGAGDIQKVDVKAFECGEYREQVVESDEDEEVSDGESGQAVGGVNHLVEE